MSAEEAILNLFDSYWFEYGVFTAKNPLSSLKTSPVLDHPQVPEEEEDQEPASDKPTKLNRITTMMRKSYSDQFLSSMDFSDSTSPKSVLGPQLQTILSGKEVDSFQDLSPHKEEEINLNRTQERAFHTEYYERNRQTGPSMKNKRRKSGSRSLSELEFEELKGCMDLGFVFSHDQETDSRLASIIPGLQRLGQNVDETNKGLSEPSVSRPYLSEAWESLEEQKRMTNPLMDWRIPAFGNELELKDHLRFWAHTVASTVS